MPAEKNELKKTRSKPAPDVLRDARRVRDILASYDTDTCASLINLALAALNRQTTEPGQ